MNDESTSPITEERALWLQCEAGSHCTLRFAHGGWTKANVAGREKFGDWPVMLDRLVALADS